MSTFRSQRALETLDRVDPAFREFCDVLYGPGVAVEDVWGHVFAKREAPKSKTQENVARASNAVGLTAGLAATGATLRDPRLAQGGKVARGLLATGNKIPSSLANAVGRLSPRGKAAAAVGAASLQLANVGGDGVVSQTLPKGVAKAGPPTNVLARGQLLLNRKMAGPGPMDNSLAGKVNQARQTQRTEATQATREARGAKVGAAVADPAKAGRSLYNTATATPGNAAVAGGGLLATGGVLGGRRQKRKAQMGYGPPEQAYYGKRAPDLEISGEFSKFDEDKRVAFGWASVVKKDGIDVVDRQGDYISAEDVEKAAYEYVLKSRKGGDMHSRVTSELGEDSPKHVADLIESVVFTDEKIEKMGLPDDFPRGWWIGMKVHDEPTWQLVKKGERTGFSIHGKGRRTETTLDEIVGY